MPVKGKTSRELGYGYEHKKLRKQIAPTVNAGRASCWRCGLPIRKGEPWDLGHHDDRSRYAGPEHQACNRATAGRRAEAQAAPAVDTSRLW